MSSATHVSFTAFFFLTPAPNMHRIFFRTYAAPTAGGVLKPRLQMRRLSVITEECVSPVLERPIYHFQFGRYTIFNLEGHY